eukprot:TRINITY_DN211_c0_g1_i2.p2 TRINITY_DN211_c0_g1~~TRINITY_DN211_c0_g1_i2.p2  ORF type:complete len:690 (-),score=102.76 TRINITY_DN211_c0_g1_i2:328-2397(-)
MMVFIRNQPFAVNSQPFKAVQLYINSSHTYRALTRRKQQLFCRCSLNEPSTSSKQQFKSDTTQMTDWFPTGTGDGSHLSRQDQSQAEGIDTGSGAVSKVDQIRGNIRKLQRQLKQEILEANLKSFPYSKTYGKTPIGAVLQSDDGGARWVGQTIRIGGWVRTGREAGAGQFAFLEVNDGSCFDNFQIVVDKSVVDEFFGEEGQMRKITLTGGSVLIEGEVARTPPGTKQLVEMKATKLHHVGQSEGKSYPLSKKKQTFEFLRENMHLRPRTNTIGAVSRIRNALAWATHTFFQENGFLYVHTPIVTASDCEGAGEMFQVTSLLSEAEKIEANPKISAEQLTQLNEAVQQQGDKIRELKQKQKQEQENGNIKDTIKSEVSALQRLKKEQEAAAEALRFKGGIPWTQNGNETSSIIDYKDDFFDKAAFLTVSGQLNAEYYACALSNVYTFGPTFRAENSNTARHLAEFWMIEPEMAFCNLEDDMRCAEDYVQFCCRYLLEHCMQDLEFIVKMIDKQAIERLEHVAYTPFRRLSYTEAIEILEDAVKNKKKKFEFAVSWGIDLASEHERYLTEEVFKQPVIVYNYPKDIKAFYMRLNDDNKTVAAMDVLVPKVGELIGGSQREERLEVLEKRIKESGMELEPYQGYLDIRRYGTVPHAGFGLGFERLILFSTGIENIREVIPFPRWPGNAPF